MAPTFGGSSNVTVDVEDLSLDNELPPAGKLDWHSVGSTTGLAGTDGVDCSLVHGDYYRQVDKDVTYGVTGFFETTIDQGELHTVGKNQTIDIGQSVTHTIGQDLTFTVTGAHNAVHVGPQNLTFVSPQCETRQAPKSMEEPTNKMESKTNDIEWIKGAEIALNWGLKTEFNTGIKFEFDNFFANVMVMKCEAVVGKTRSEALSAKVQGLANKLAALVGEAAPAEADAKIEVNALVVFVPDGLLG